MTPGTSAIEVRSRDGSTRFVDVVGIPSPKDGCPLGAGLEHVEFVVGDGSHESPANGDAHRVALTAWMEMHPSVPRQTVKSRRIRESGTPGSRKCVGKVSPDAARGGD